MLDWRAQTRLYVGFKTEKVVLHLVTDLITVDAMLDTPQSFLSLDCLQQESQKCIMFNIWGQ